MKQIALLAFFGFVVCVALADSRASLQTQDELSLEADVQDQDQFFMDSIQAGMAKVKAMLPQSSKTSTPAANGQKKSFVQRHKKKLAVGAALGLGGLAYLGYKKYKKNKAAKAAVYQNPHAQPAKSNKMSMAKKLMAGVGLGAVAGGGAFALNKYIKGRKAKKNSIVDGTGRPIGKGIGFPRHGSYCSEVLSKKRLVFTKTPVDSVDGTCKTVKECYLKNDYDCSCHAAGAQDLEKTALACPSASTSDCSPFANQLRPFLKYGMCKCNGQWTRGHEACKAAKPLSIAGAVTATNAAAAFKGSALASAGAAAPSAASASATPTAAAAQATATEQQKEQSMMNKIMAKLKGMIPGFSM